MLFQMFDLLKVIERKILYGNFNESCFVFLYLPNTRGQTILLEIHWHFKIQVGGVSSTFSVETLGALREGVQAYIRDTKSGRKSSYNSKPGR